MARKQPRPILQSLDDLVAERPDSKAVANKYKVLGKVVSDYYPLREIMSPDTIKEMLRDVVTLDRRLRQHCEGHEVDLKKFLAQQKQVELGYGHYQDIKNV